MGNGGGTVYESRLRFASMAAGAADVLRKALEGLEARDVRRWTANLRGWEPEPEPVRHPALVTATFLRYRLHGLWWEKKATHHPTQPEDGFTVPADTDESEIASLCRTYETVDAGGRQVIRAIAAEVVAQTCAVAKNVAALGR
jgi:hypothetical protein